MQKVFHPFDPFVVLFTIGFTFAGIFLIFKVIRWIEKLSPADKELLNRGMFTAVTWRAILEVIRESLLHRKIWLSNRRLGYMHMSLAFGWFMLILIGNIESVYYSGRLFKPIYVSVFWRFFDPGQPFPQAAGFPGFAFWMDFFLLMVLSGLVLAIWKRLHSRTLGMRHTTRQRPVDRIGLTSLWLIFPVRLLAESATCGANGTGSFLTGTLGHLLASGLNPSLLVLPFWWTYSFVLMVFFISLPFTRYAHIPSEAVLIFLRKYGIRVSKASPGFTDLSLHACSGCGICMDACQLTDALPGRRIQSNYFIRSVRYGRQSDIQWDCLQCGRCEEACPVGLDLMPIRHLSREDVLLGTQCVTMGHGRQNKHTGRVLYFAGCMTHLTPGIIHSMTRIFSEAGADWQFYDSGGRACCGRPLKLAGQDAGAARIREQLQDDFLSSGAELLITSCPICYRMFREEYILPGMRVMHHTEYLLQLMDWNRIRPVRSALKAAYHEPCELGRGSGVVREPREIMARLFAADVTPATGGLCCGSSLGAPSLSLATRRTVARTAFGELAAANPDLLVTACPLCKKAFSPVADIPVMDFAEAVALGLGCESTDDLKLFHHPGLAAGGQNKIVAGRHGAGVERRILVASDPGE
jgi:Fe-S oxidoreductase